MDATTIEWSGFLHSTTVTVSVSVLQDVIITSQVMYYTGFVENPTAVVCFVCLSRFRITKFVKTETLLSSVIFKTNTCMYLKTFIRSVIQILKQYSITQPEIVPKLVATFRSPTASFIRLVVT